MALICLVETLIPPSIRPPHLLILRYSNMPQWGIFDIRAGRGFNIGVNLLSGLVQYRRPRWALALRLPLRRRVQGRRDAPWL